MAVPGFEPESAPRERCRSAPSEQALGRSRVEAADASLAIRITAKRRHRLPVPCRRSPGRDHHTTRDQAPAPNDRKRGQRPATHRPLFRTPAPMGGGCFEPGEVAAKPGQDARNNRRLALEGRAGVATGGTKRDWENPRGEGIGRRAGCKKPGTPRLVRSMSRRRSLGRNGRHRREKKKPTRRMSERRAGPTIRPRIGTTRPRCSKQRRRALSLGETRAAGRVRDGPPC